LPIFDLGESNMTQIFQANLLSFRSDNPKSKIENLKWWGIFAIAYAFAFGGAVARTEQPAKIPRIGYIESASLSANTGRIEAFRKGLRDLGYVEGKNIVIERRYAEGKADRVHEFAAELVHLKIDVIVTAGASITRAAREATSTIPIVMSQDPDPVGDGFVASLARPGGNITGLSAMVADLSGKRLELLKEIVPKLSRLAVFETSTNAGNAQQLRETKVAAEAFRLKFQELDVLGLKDIENAFRAASKGRADAGLVLSSAVTSSYRKQLADFAVKNRLPVTYPRTDFVEDGGLMSYGVNVIDLDRRAAAYVDKILKGAKPADLPVEQPKKFEFVINLKAAKQISLTIPPNVLARADKVIK